MEAASSLISEQVLGNKNTSVTQNWNGVWEFSAVRQYFSSEEEGKGFKEINLIMKHC